ncbi:MAG: hypothetical protein ABIC95_03680 [archaeon]
MLFSILKEIHFGGSFKMEHGILNPMTTLIACLSTGKGTWAEVVALINTEEWENIFLLTNEFGKEKFTSPKDAELIVLDAGKSMDELFEQMRAALDGKVSGTEVAMNLSSGSGKEHMALIAAVLKLGLGLRLVTAQDGKMVVVC